MIRVQMLNENKSHTRISGQILEQLGERFQAASGCANADDREMLLNPAFWWFDFSFTRFSRQRHGCVQDRALLTIGFERFSPAESSRSLLAILCIHKIDGVAGEATIAMRACEFRNHPHQLVCTPPLQSKSFD